MISVGSSSNYSYSSRMDITPANTGSKLKSSYGSYMSISP